MKQQPDYDYILKDIPVFSGLSPKQHAYVKQKARFLEFKKGQVIYKEGAAPSFYYCVIRGRVAVSTQDRYGKQTILEHLHRGKYFGVISSLTGEPHSVTAKAINDALLLAINKDDFEMVLRKVPQLAIELGRVLSRRLKHKDFNQKIVFESTIISVLSSYPQAGKTVYASNLAFGISREAHKRVIILDICPPKKIHRLPRVLGMRGAYRVFNLSSKIVSAAQFKEYILKDSFGIDLMYMTYAHDDPLWQNAVVEILSRLVNEYHYCIIDLPTTREQTVLNILNQADIIHILTSSRTLDLRSTRNLLNTLDEDFHFPEQKIKIVLNATRQKCIASEDTLKLLGHDIYASLPRIEARASGRVVIEDPQSPYSKVMRRIARQEGDCLVGLALGVGAAYGLCHIGVLKVLEEEKIPIDVISGASIGSVIASLWATGRSSAEILHITQEFRQPQYILNLLDFTLPLQGFIKGNKLYSFLKKYLGNMTFYDVRIPLKIVASDVKRRESLVLERGSLVDAIMASCSMPGIFMPFKMKGQMLFDGGVLSPLPTEPLIEMGVKRIIAVNVTPSREDIKRQYDAVKDDIDGDTTTVHGREWFDLKRYFKEKFKTNILDFIFSSFEIMQSEVAQKEAQLADVVLHPNLSGLHWLALHKSDAFAKRGEEEARSHIDMIKQLIS
ncbi:MAG: patatin-like phospholipase family protein [Candidatus Omnitrophota bacterium]